MEEMRKAGIACAAKHFPGEGSEERDQHQVMGCNDLSVESGIRVSDGFAVVSSANRDDVEEEWTRFGLLPLVDLVHCQDVGSKAHCISELKKEGYAEDYILMVGEAPGDESAAESNGVFCYPILVRHETESWAEFPQAARRLYDGTFRDFGEMKAREFLANLQG